MDTTTPAQALMQAINGTRQFFDEMDRIIAGAQARGEDPNAAVERLQERLLESPDDGRFSFEVAQGVK